MDKNETIKLLCDMLEDDAKEECSSCTLHKKDFKTCSSRLCMTNLRSKHIKEARELVALLELPPLIFKKTTQEGGLGVFIIFYEYEFEYAGLKVVTRFHCEDKCIAFANSLNRTYKFIDEE